VIAVKHRSLIVAAFVFVVLGFAPAYLGSYHLLLVGRFLSLGILAMGIVMVWGQGGVLPLGQGVFFGLGGYAIAMHLKLVALPAGELPDFMQWNGVEQLPWWWQPFTSAGLAIAGVFIIPGLVALVLAWLVFRRRMTSVYIALITQALALAFATLLISQQGSTGGFNGLTNFDTLFGVSLSDDSTRLWLHVVTVAFAALAYFLARALETTQAGVLVAAVRDGENRVRFLGYSPAPYKILVFVIAGVLAGLGGALHTLHLGLISPAMVGVVPSIEMVIWVAVGGRQSLPGALVGTLLVNVSKDWISSELPDAWLYVMGFLFVVVVVATPRGLAGILESVTGRLHRAVPPARPASEPGQPLEVKAHAQG
jgi:urea transport system permease protein